MGTIHLAVAGGLAEFRKLLVVKELRQDLSSNRRFVEMFLDEANLAARLNHPNVVQTLEAGQQGDRYFLSMEFLDGQPYSAIWQAANQFPHVSLPIRLKILCEALAGLHYAHTLTEYDGRKLQIVHRDVSPQNIFVTYDGQVKVVDFGIAKATVSTAFSSPSTFKGKFGYAAPEQVRGENVDARTDVFAMGVLLWETLTMQRFSDGVVNRAAVATRLAGHEPRASQLRPRVHPRLAVICDRALAIDPAARFASADDFRVALEEFIAQCGERVDASAIKQVLAHKFAAERRAIHRLIDHHIKHGAVESLRVSAAALGSEAGNNHPTQVADLSKFVSNTTNETVVSGINQTVVSDVARELTRPPRWRSKRTLAVVAVAAVAALGVGLGLLLISASEDADAPTVTTIAPESPAPPPLQPKAAGVKPDATPSSERSRPSGVRAAPPKPSTELEPAPAVRSVQGRMRARAAAAVTEAPQPEVTSSAQPPAEALPARVEPAAVEPAEKVSVGADLNRVEKSYQRRTIDTEL
jgi:eukaryotic-like serine/threonine-protein kinase